MGLRRLLNVFYAALVEAAGGTDEGKANIDEILLRGDPDPEAEAERLRKKHAEENREAVAALRAAFG